MEKLSRDRSVLNSAVSILLAVFMLGALSACSTDRTVVGAGYSSYPYDYYYYPHSRVYFSLSTGYYFYPEGAKWIKVRVLPSRFYLDTRGRVTVKIRSVDRPYAYHNTHRVRYAPQPQYRVDRSRDQIERKLNRDRYKRFRRR